MTSRKPLTPESLRTLLLEELSPKFEHLDVAMIAVSTVDGSSKWIVEVRTPVHIVRVFQPEGKGQLARARLFVADVEQWIMAATRSS